MERLNLPKYRYSNTLGWSHSRWSTFASCLRKYYYTYYDKTPQIQQLKKQRTYPLVFGEVVHEMLDKILSTVLEEGEVVSSEDIHTMAGKLLAKSARNITGPIDVEYAGYEAAEMVEEFTHSPTFKKIKDYHGMPGKFVIEPPSYGETRLLGLKAYVKVDFAIQGPNRHVEVYDWKTGSLSYVNPNQMKAYAAWARNVFGVKGNMIVSRFIGLRDGQILTYTFDDDELDMFLNDDMISQITNMTQMLVDVSSNTPHPIEVFPLTQDTVPCTFCNFKTVCGR